MKRTVIYLMILFITSTITFAGSASKPIRLVIYPSKMTEADKQYRLLPKAEELTDEDAVQLYQKAIQSLPKNLDSNQIRQWLDAPLSELPVQKVQSTLESLQQTIKVIDQASKCKQCNWPEVDPEAASIDLSMYRSLIYIMSLKIRLEIKQGQYEQALDTIQAGLVMGRNLCKSPMLIQGLVGISVTAYTLRQVEELIQVEDGPNLYWALAALPQPLIDLTEQTALESPETRGRVTSQTNRLSRHLAALQTIEAIRLHAGKNNGEFPEKLSDITEVPVPDDPIAKKPFTYTRTGSKAVLEGEASKGSEGRDEVKYELDLKEN